MVFAISGGRSTWTWGGTRESRKQRIMADICQKYNNGRGYIHCVLKECKHLQLRFGDNRFMHENQLINHKNKD
jgi:hypothetical protein